MTGDYELASVMTLSMSVLRDLPVTSWSCDELTTVCCHSVDCLFSQLHTHALYELWYIVCPPSRPLRVRVTIICRPRSLWYALQWVTVCISSATTDLLLIQQNLFCWISNRPRVAELI